MTHYVNELKRLGQYDLIKSFASKAKMKKIEAFIDNSFCSAQLKIAMKSLIRKRYAELINGL
jgi:hypothetical protein